MKEVQKGDAAGKVNAALWRVFRRPERPRPWQNGGNLPWDDPAFSERMLREHLDQTHGAASRTDGERALQLPWLWDKLGLQAGDAVLDVTCGPGLYAVALAGRGCRVTGVDFGPAAIAYARELALAHEVAELCTFVQQDVRKMTVPQEAFDAALLLYGQLAVMERTEAAALLETIAAALKPGGRLVVELLDQDRVDKEDSTWWFTDDKGLWGERPFLHLGERYWLADEALSMERYHIVDLETGQLDEILLCDQTYGMDEMGEIFRTAGFAGVDIYPAWDGVSLYDAAEWIVYVAVK